MDKASPVARELYDGFVAKVSECGPFQVSPVRTYIGFRGKQRVFAGVRPDRDRLMGYLDLPRKVISPRFRGVSDYSKSLWVHQFALRSVDELDDEFVGWLAEAYQIGRERPRRS